MKNIKISTSDIKNNIEADIPVSKSYAIRVCAAAFLANDNKTIEDIKNNVDNQDIISALNCIEGIFHKNTSSCGESALAMRLFTFIASLSATQDEPIKFIAEGSLRTRGLEELSIMLKYFGIKNIFETEASVSNITVLSQIQSGEYILNNINTSQILTGALMTLPLCKKNSVIKVNKLPSKYYLDLTLEIIEKFGIFIENKNYKEFYIEGNQKYHPADIILEKDWSAAANLFVLGATRGNVKISKLNINSKQPDKIIYDFLKKIGIKINHNGNIIEIEKSIVPGFSFDATDYPDLIPPLVALALNSSGTSYITGVHRLTNKESNRCDVLLNEFTKLGIDIKLDKKNDKFIIIPSSSTTNNNIFNIKNTNSKTVSAHNDHRIAMALGIAAAISKEKINILEANSVNKSFPKFWDTICNN